MSRKTVLTIIIIGAVVLFAASWLIGRGTLAFPLTPETTLPLGKILLSASLAVLVVAVVLGRLRLTRS